MQDLDDGRRAGRRRLSAVPGDRVAVAGRPRASVVPAQRLLDVASALSDGATKLHAQLRHLDPAERDALLDLVAEQVTVVLTLWSELVRGVVSSDDPAPRPASTSAPGGGDVDEEPVPDPLGSGHHPTRMPGRGATGGAHRAPGVEEPERYEDGRLAQGTTRPSSPASRHPGTNEANRDTRDELTGVLNRHAGLAALQRELERCQRAGERFVLGYVNVDGTRVVNDTRGSRAGDELLRKVSAALRATLRSYDVVARLGGDEFLFSLPGADTVTADLRFKEFAVILSEAEPGSSASVGFAELHDHAILDDLVAEAEAAMLRGRRARRRGRG